MVRFNSRFGGLKSLLLLAIAALPVFVNAQNCGVSVSDYTLSMGAGWGAYTLVSTLTRPRQIIFDQQGRLLVADVGRGIQQLTLGSNGNCITVQSTKLLIQDSQLNHGVELSPDGTKLWASSLNAVYVWDYNQAAGTVANKRTVVSGMNFGGHPTRTILHPRSKPGVILVQEGSIDNIDMACNAQQGCLIKEFDIATIPSTPYDYINGGRVLGWGLRNSVGVAEASNGGIWSVENSADNIRRNNVDVHQNNPAEEMNYHGILSSTSNSFFGKNYGYPTCFAVWQPNEIPSIGTLQTGDQFLFQPNNTFSDATCQQQFQKPYLTFPAHTAPLDIKFYKPDVTGGTCETNTQYGGLGCDYVDDAFVAFHGSWNRDQPIGYNFAHINFQNNQPAAQSNSQTGYTEILKAPNLSQCPSRCFRPVGIAFDPRGRILVSSDDRGDIIVVTRAVTAAPTTSVPTQSSTSTPSTTSIPVVTPTTTTPTTTYTPPTTTSIYTPPPTPTPTCTVAKYGQCGGANWSSCTNCAAGSRCNKQNDWYSQCI